MGKTTASSKAKANLNSASAKRVGFLCKAAALLQAKANSQPSSAKALGFLARSYAQCSRAVALKTQTAIHPYLKRSFCKQCRQPFVIGAPNPSFRVRHRRVRKQLTLIVTCLHCGHFRRFLAKPDKVAAFDDPNVDGGKSELPPTGPATK